MSSPPTALPTDRELQLLLKPSSEDSFVERKTFGDWKSDALKTIVAFANSAPIGYPAILYVGVEDNGTPQAKTDNLDKIQNTLSELAANIYPPAYYFTRIFREEGKDILAVIVPGSAKRPHFSGAAYVRQGSKSVKASDVLYDELVAQSSSVSGEILKWKGKKITLSRPQHYANGFRHYTQERVVETCNAIYVTLGWPVSLGNTPTESFPIESIRLSYDHPASRLMIHIADESLAYP